MSSAGERARIAVERELRVDNLDPLAGVTALRGARVYDIGQGDSIAIVDADGEVVFQIDYGGKEKNPFKGLKGEARVSAVDSLMPIPSDRFVMLSHWDEDHWCSAPKGSEACAARWLVPRQVTSPAAVEFASDLDKDLDKERIACIPEDLVGIPDHFTAGNGDELWWEKIGVSARDPSEKEDCNHTGVAFSLVRRSDSGGQVILLPGDAPFGSVGHYASHRAAGLTLTGIVAFHHGAGTHWTAATRGLLRNWPKTAAKVDVAFSCAENSSYKHPILANYQDLFGADLRSLRTDALPRSGTTRFVGIDFV